MTGGSEAKPSALRRALDVVVCPVCAEALRLDERSLRCSHGHTFDLARQGYVSLLAGGPPSGTGDTGAMVRARADLLSQGHYAPLADAVASLATEVTDAPRMVVDAGVGTGYYLTTLLERHPDATGLGIDTSKYALRRAARAHPRVAAAACDVWRRLPIRDASVDAVLNVFSPRNPLEFRRVLRPDGTLVVARPTERHLVELRQELDLIAIDEDKEDRLTRGLGDRFALAAERHVEYTNEFSPHSVADAALMGPSAHHLDDTRMAEFRQSAESVPTTVSVLVTAYRPL